MSWFSRVIATVSRSFAPVFGRVQARFEGAQTTGTLSNHFAYADSMDARASLSPQVRSVLRKRMRYEDENCCWLNGLLTTAANHIVGNGPRLQVLVEDRVAGDRLEAAWAEFANAIGLVSVLKTAVRTDWRDGECVGLRRRADVHPEFRVVPRLYEAEQLGLPWQAVTDPNIDDGVEVDSESGLPVRYHILRQHPGANYAWGGSLEGDWYDASDVIHTYRADRPGQLRGVSRGASGLVDLATLRRFERATLIAAENAARSPETIETAGAAGTPSSSQSDFFQINLPDGGATFLPQGWHRNSFKPEHPATTYEMFTRQQITKWCRPYCMPYHIAVGSSRESNYSSAVLDQSIAWVAEVTSEQRRFERQFVEKLFRWFLDEAVFVPGLLDGLPEIERIPHAWQWDPPPTGDELDRIKAAVARVDAGLSAPSTEAMLLGRDFTSEERRAAQDYGVTPGQLRMLRLSLKFPSASAGVPADPAAGVASAAPGGEFGGLGRRQWQNNVKAVRDVLNEAIAGRSSRAASAALLETLGLAPERAAALLDDALSDGRVDDTEVAQACGVLSLEAAATVTTLNGPAVVALSAAESGKARRFDILAYTGGKLNVSGAPLPVVVDLSALTVAQNVPILIDHTKSVESTLGQVEAVENDGTTLRLRGSVTGASPKCLQVLAQADKGHKWQASIGCNYEGIEIPAGQVVAVNGQQIEGPFILARSAELRETSVLPMGADSRTTVNLAAAAALSGKANAMTFEDWLKSLGMDPATQTPEALAALQKVYDSQQASEAEAKAKAAAPVATATATPTPAPAVAAGANLDLTAASVTMLGLMRKQAAEEAARIGAIREIVAEIPDVKARGRIEATAIGEGWTREKTELAALKEVRPKAPSGIVHNHDSSPQVLEAALALSAGLASPEKHYSAETLDKAQRQFRNLGLQRLLMIEACARGYVSGPHEGVHSGNLRAVLEAAFGRYSGSLAATNASTLSLPGILSNVANKEILRGYMEEDQTWRELATVKTVRDFKQVTSYRMLDDMQYEELPPGGKIKEGKLGEESYTRQAKTYAKMFQFDRADILNDDLGAFDDIRNRLGSGAAKKLNNVYWTKFLDNASFFTSARGNYISGATTNLGTDGVGLGLGLKAFRDMKSPKVKSSDSDSQRYRIGGNPEILVVPPELEDTANRIYLTDPAVATAVSGTNTYYRKYRPVVVPWLSDSAFTGFSTTAWYLMRAPQRMAAMVVSFLNGQQTPTVESSDAEFDTLGIVFRGYHDFGVDQAEYLAGVKSKGAA